MSPTLSKLPLENESDEHFVDLIPSLLSPAECADLICKHSPSLIGVSGTYSMRLRHIYRDEKLSNLLWSRLEQFYGEKKVTDAENQTWTAKSLNPYFRFCKYKAGDAFGPHVDGKRLVSLDEQSFMTVNIYLNTVPSSAGGATRVLARPAGYPDFSANDEFDVIGRMQPGLGMAAVFRDSLFHDGEVLGDGEKYLLRTDVMFERDVPFDFDTLYAGLSKVEKGRKAMDLALRLEDGGNQDGAVVWYRKAFKLDPELERTG